MIKDKRSRQRQAHNYKLIRSAKERPCADCGIQYPYWVMQFDHVRGIKVINLSKCYLATTGKILGEINKCDVVCANCHANRTHKIFGRKAGYDE